MPVAAADLDRLIRTVPKVELHLHIEGTLEPEMVFALADKHHVRLPYKSVDALRAAYKFDNLQSFLDLYYAGCDVLRDERDFYMMASAYFARAHADNVVHAELFFDPQTHTVRGVPMDVVIGGLRNAMDDADKRYGITSSLILCFLRHLSEEDAFATLDAARPFLREIAGVGLDSGEKGNPPSKFERVFAKARAMGLRPVAHAGEEGPAAYVKEALDLLHVERIDHGVRCDEDPALVDRIVRERIPLTVCPLSNLKLCVVKRLEDHNFAKLLRKGVAVTINSDDPAYFGGYIGDNYRAIAKAVGLTAEEIVAVTDNAIRASFLPAEQKAALLGRLRAAAARSMTAVDHVSGGRLRGAAARA
jgi:adenosine deaminase